MIVSHDAENISVHSSVDDEEPFVDPELILREEAMNRYTALCQQVGTDLSICLGSMCHSLQLVSAGIDSAALLDDSKLGLSKETIVNKSNSNETIVLYLSETMSILSEASVSVANQLSRLVIANSLRDQKLDPRCNKIRFSDGHYEISFPSSAQMNSQTGPGSNVFTRFRGTRVVDV